ncbi:MAG: ABC transporter permease [Thiobacillaceae bacterium]|jgi:putative ABC transport system permease protein|nr:ABC transporter permease [Thiobacillaceae bacterium]
MLKLAFRNIFRNRLRTSLTLAAIVSGVVAIIVSGGFVEDVFIQLREATIHSRIGHMQVYREGYLEFAKREPARYLIEDPKPAVQALQGIPGVAGVMTRLNFSGLANNGRADLPIVGEAVEVDQEARFGGATTIVAGRPLRDSDAYGVLVGEGVAAALHLKPGKYVTLVVNTHDGALNTLEFEVIGVFRTFFKEYDDRAVRIPQAASQELMYTAAVDNLVVSLNETEATDAVLAQVKAKLEPLGYEVKPWYELADFYEKTVALYRRQFGALQFIILVMLVLSVASTVNMAVYERTGEFGTMLALGQRRGTVFRLVLLEYSLLGLIGSLAGLVLGVLLALGISSVGIPMPPPPGSNADYVASVRVVPGVLLMALAVGAVAATLAAVLPGRRAARLPVVDALRHNI